MRRMINNAPEVEQLKVKENQLSVSGKDITNLEVLGLLGRKVLNGLAVGTITEGGYLSNGNFVPDSNYAVTDFIPVEQHDKVYFSDSTTISYYGANKEFLTQEKIAGPNFTHIAALSIKYVRYNLEKAKVSPEREYIYVVKPNDNIYEVTYSEYSSIGYCFTSLKKCIEHINNHDVKNAKVFLSRDIDLVSEYGQAALDSMTGTGGHTYEGLKLYNNIHIINNNNSTIYFPYNGTNAYIVENFSPFNICGDATLENVIIDCKNCRYCVHEDIGVAKAAGLPFKLNYYVKYLNCRMNHQGNTRGTYRTSLCIGAGVGLGSVSEIYGGIYSNVSDYNAPISYHKYNSGATPASKVIADHVVLLNDKFNLSDFGQGSPTAFISNCILPGGIGHGTGWNVYGWNNITEPQVSVAAANIIPELL